MNNISEEQINLVFEGDSDVPIFDQDNWDESIDVSNDSWKKIPMKINSDHKTDNMRKKISDELACSKENFCRVNIIKTPLKGPNTQLKPLQSSRKIEAISEKNVKTVLKQGKVEKKTDGIFFQWHCRYMALTVEKIYFFNDENKERVIGCINLKIMLTKVYEKEGKIILDFMGECDNVILKFSTQDELKQWKSWIEKVINFQTKQSKLMLKTMVKPLYELKDSMSEKQFIDTAETGDILLFQTKNTGAKIQRVLTNSQYDHVAMIVRFRKKEIMVFESNAMHGVAVFEWSQYIRYFDLYEKVTLRKLNYLRKTQIHHSLMNFVKKNLGKTYDIGAHKFFKLESDFNWDAANKQLKMEEQKRGYFCSELIAKAYKSVGVIDSKKSSGRYWPVDFSDKNEMLLKKGAWLGPEQSIILNKHVKNLI